MYTINVSFKDILRIGTADSSFSVIWTGLVHGFLQVFVHQCVFSFVHGSMDLSPSTVPCSSVVPQSLNLRRSPVLLSFTAPRTCFFHQSGSSSSVVPQSLNLHRSPVLLSFTGPRTCLGHQSAVPFVPGPRTCVVHRSPLRHSFVGSPFLCHSPVLITGSRIRLVHRFPLPPSFIGAHFPCCSSVSSRCTVLVWECCMCRPR